ncbi:MAG: 16S rRNA (cytosine(1402)-N(4))-methyltransferase RsmH [Ferrimicrobium sp.]
MMPELAHAPVLVAEVVATFETVPSGVICDVTVGAGGHASAILDSRLDLSILGIDRDQSALELARSNLARFGSRVHLAHGSFSDLTDLVEGKLSTQVVGVLADLGVSSMQLDTRERGFSFLGAAPLDMRMDTSGTTPTAADVLSDLSRNELIALLVTHGSGSLASRYADAIIKGRPITTSDQLASLIEAATPARLRRERRTHPATAVFQALRVVVNDEEAQLIALLPAAVSVCAPGGRIAVLSYHSGEDRVVKRFFREMSTGGCHCLPQLPCVCGAQPVGVSVTRKSVVASEAERAINPRARSARLRVVERVGGEVEGFIQRVTESEALWHE